MKKLMAALLLGLCAQAHALEIEGVKLPEKVQMGQSALELNGAGVRSMFIFDIYVAALYLPSRHKTADEIFADQGPKRMELHVVYETGSERLVTGFRKGIERNSTPAQLAALQARMDAFEKAFAGVNTVAKGDVVAFDWAPGQGTRIVFNGKHLAAIPGEDFYRALLSIWIGDNPVTDALKRELLGQ